MVITIIQEKKKQRYLLLALAAIIFGVLSVIWFGFSAKKKQAALRPVSPAVYAVPETEIDKQMLEELRLKAFGKFEEINPFEKEFGRKNPFIAY